MDAPGYGLLWPDPVVVVATQTVSRLEDEAYDATYAATPRREGYGVPSVYLAPPEHPDLPSPRRARIVAIIILACSLLLAGGAVAAGASNPADTNCRTASIQPCATPHSR